MQQIVLDRRALHQIPELDRELDLTMGYLRRALSPLRCELSSPIPGSLCAYFDNGADSAIAFRSDADALPVAENTNLAFQSRHPGKMHACGHDAHMAICLELARRLNGLALTKNVLLIFQPAEETTGGARDICKSGIFEKYRVEAIFGLHLWPELPSGQIASRENELMSRSCEVTVEIKGKSSHIAKAEEGIDALAAGFEFYRRAQLAERDFPEKIYRLIRFGRMTSGDVRNAVSAHTRMEGTLRAFQDEVFFGILNKLEVAAREISESTGCEIKLTTSTGYPAVMNPPKLYRKLRGLGLDFSDLERPVMITEDFSWYQQHLPGLFFFLGTGPSPALHADNFNFDERILSIGADFMESVARMYGR